MAIPGTVQVSGPIAPTSTTVGYPSHLEEYGQGNFRTVEDATERLAIPAERRKKGMEVKQWDTKVVYELEADLTTWTPVTGGIDPADVMLKSDYDPNDDLVVNNAALLAGETAADIRDRALHTGAQAISTVTGLRAALDAKIETSEVGVANGVVPTNGSNKIDNAYLNFTLPLDPVIAWNPVTNTPAISDAGGAAGEIYIVYDSGNPTARDLGSGSENWSDGDAAIFDSGTSTFVRVGGYAVGVIDVTTDAGTQSGAVVIDDTTHIAPSTDRNYVTDDQLAAIPVGANGSDKLILNSELISALLLVSSSVNIYPELFANNETLGDGTARTLDSLGYNAGTAAAAWPRTDALRTIDVNTWTIDDVSWQEMCYFMLQQGAQYSITPSGKGYVFAVGVLIPKDQIAVPLETRSLRYTFDLRNSRISSVNNIILFDRYPADQAEAADYRLDYAYDFINGMMVGNNSSNRGDCALRLGGTNHSTLKNLELYKFGCALDLQFCLNMDVQNVKLQSYGLYGVYAGDGLWSGAGINISQTNVFTTHKLRLVNDELKTNVIAGAYLSGSQNNELNFTTCEGGGTPQHIILYDNLQATTTKYNLVLNGTYIEGVGATRAGIRFRSNSGTCLLKGFSAQGNSTDLPVLFEAETIGAPAASPLFIKIEDQPDFNFGWKFRQNAVQKYRVTDVKLNDMTNFAAAINWDTGIVGSTIPTSDYYTYLRPIA